MHLGSGSSLILRTATKFMLPLLVLFSIFLLLRGHNQPGGGFAGGLVAGAAVALYALAFGVEASRHALGVDSRVLTGVGLATALTSVVIPLFIGEPAMNHKPFWLEFYVSSIGKVHIGTPLVFDLGVYLVVVGMSATIVLPLMEE